MALIGKMLPTARVAFRATRIHIEVSDILIKVKLNIEVHKCSYGFALSQMQRLTGVSF